MNTTLNEPLSRSDLRKFGLIMAGGITLFFGIVFPLLRDRGIDPTSWPWYLALALIATALALPNILRPVHAVWMKIGAVLGFVNTRIILGIIYLALFTPTALVLKLLKKDPMRRTFDAEAASYRIQSRQPKLENLNRPY